MIKPAYASKGITLFHADCLEIIPGLENVNVIITDPPYGIRLVTRKGLKIVGDESPELGQFVLDFLNYKFSSPPMAAFASPKIPWKGKWNSLLVWDKGGGVGGGGDCKRSWKLTWELIQVNTRNPLNGKREASVIKQGISSQFLQIHPNRKPVDLVAYLIEKLSQPGQTILDPFMGSGTTGLACLMTGRKFIGIEKDPQYFKLSQKRILEEMEKKE